MLAQIRSLIVSALCIAAIAGPAAATPRCASHDALVKVLNSKYKETRRALGVVSATQVMEIFMSAEGTWTMLVTDTHGTSCITAAGEAWQDVKIEVAGLDS